MPYLLDYSIPNMILELYKRTGKILPKKARTYLGYNGVFLLQESVLQGEYAGKVYFYQKTDKTLEEQELAGRFHLESHDATEFNDVLMVLWSVHWEEMLNRFTH